MGSLTSICFPLSSNPITISPNFYTGSGNFSPLPLTTTISAPVGITRTITLTAPSGRSVSATLSINNNGDFIGTTPLDDGIEVHTSTTNTFEITLIKPSKLNSSEYKSGDRYLLANCLGSFNYQIMFTRSSVGKISASLT